MPRDQIIRVLKNDALISAIRCRTLRALIGWSDAQVKLDEPKVYEGTVKPDRRHKQLISPDVFRVYRLCGDFPAPPTPEIQGIPLV